DSEDDHPASEGKVTTGTEGAFEAQVVKGKEPLVVDTAVATPKRKRADKEKVEIADEQKKKKQKVTKSKELRRKGHQGL
ncbi:hypothetical protein A2U01_0069082, partial [Trifolium medium]|nr:hypothetical protein [Trifolium medium]